MEIKKADEKIEKEIHEKLKKFNEKFTKYSGDLSLYIEEDGENIGGVVGTAIGETLDIDFLCIDEKYRGRGYAKKLMLALEEEAKKHNLKRIVLDTYEFQAPKFYEKLGYKLYCKLENAWGEYTKYFYIKEI